MASPIFARKVYKLQNVIVRELNDGHIFLEQVGPLLEEAKAHYAESTSKKDKRYYVPSVRKSKYASRTDKELKSIYDHYLGTGLYEAFLVNSVARFEWFLADILTEFLKHHPLRITEKVQGIHPCERIEVAALLEANDKAALVRKVIAEHVSNVFRQRPSIYMAYISKLMGIKDDPSFLDFYEISATRDLIVHNSRTVNELYVNKSGAKARAVVGKKVLVDEVYYSSSIANMKSVAGAIKRDVEKKYGAMVKPQGKQ